MLPYLAEQKGVARFGIVAFAEVEQEASVQETHRQLSESRVAELKASLEDLQARPRRRVLARSCRFSRIETSSFKTLKAFTP